MGWRGLMKCLDRLIKTLGFAIILGLASVLTGCVSLMDYSEPFVILRSALTDPIDQLDILAEKGEARPQYALAIVYEYGLRGKPRQPSFANTLKQKAMAMRGYTTITQYIAGLNGAPGRTVLINTPNYIISPYEAQANDSCAALLNESINYERSVKTCGGQVTYDELKTLWDKSR
jgi:hypothetical protein